MKDGEVVFLIAGFAALAFLMTKDKSGKEEKPSQEVIDMFGPADEPMVQASEWEGGSELTAAQDEPALITSFISDWYRTKYISYLNVVRVKAAEVIGLINRAQVEQHPMGPLREGLRNSLDKLLNDANHLHDQLRTYLDQWATASGYQGQDGRRYFPNPNTSPYFEIYERLGKHYEILQGWVQANNDRIEELKDLRERPNIYQTQHTTFVAQGFDQMSQSSYGHPPPPASSIVSASVQSTFDAANKEAGYNTLRVQTAAQKHKGADAKDTSTKNQAGKRGSHAFMQVDVQGDPTAEEDENKAAAKEKTSSLTAQAQTGPPVAPDPRATVDPDSNFKAVPTPEESKQEENDPSQALGDKRGGSEVDKADIQLANLEIAAAKKHKEGTYLDPDEGKPVVAPVEIGQARKPQPLQSFRVPPPEPVEKDTLPPDLPAALQEGLAGFQAFEGKELGQQRTGTQAELDPREAKKGGRRPTLAPRWPSLTR